MKKSFYFLFFFSVLSFYQQPAVYAEEVLQAAINLEVEDSIVVNIKEKNDIISDMSQGESLLALTNVTILGLYSPLLLKDERKGLWVRPYASYDEVKTGGGKHSDLTMYGNLIGADFGLKNLKNDWQRTVSGYVGYRGNHQNFSGTNVVSNSGLVGASATFYHKDFFAFWTTDVGSGVSNASNGQEVASVSCASALRTGYNLNFKNKITVQPNYIMSYTFASNFNSRDNNGDLFKSQPLNQIQIIPSFRAYANLKNDLKPFLVVNMVFPVLGNEKMSINNYALPGVSMYPFVEYGGGVQKQWKNDSSGFVQLLVRNGGRTGVGVLLGFKYALGPSETAKKTKISKGF